jgi:hypothetical protein
MALLAINPHAQLLTVHAQLIAVLAEEVPHQVVAAQIVIWMVMFSIVARTKLLIFLVMF